MIENILKRIRSDAEKEVSEIQRAAFNSARQIEEAAEKKALSLKTEILTKAGQEASREKERIIVETQIQLKKDILSFKQEQLKEVFVKAFDRIRDSEKIYPQFLEKTLAQLTRGEEEIIFSMDDRKNFSKDWLEQFNKKNKRRLKYSKEGVKISGGVIIRLGKKEINASIKALMKEIKEKYEAETAKILFGEL